MNDLVIIDEDGDPIYETSLVVDCSICHVMVLSTKVEHRTLNGRPVCWSCAGQVETIENQKGIIHEHSKRYIKDPLAKSADEEDSDLEWEMRYSGMYRILEDGDQG